jgi:hypothetical protein
MNRYLAYWLHLPGWAENQAFFLPPHTMQDGKSGFEGGRKNDMRPFSPAFPRIEAACFFQ